MSNTIQKTTSSVMKNIPGAIVGGAAGWYVAKKFIKSDKKWVMPVSILVGVIAGAAAQAKFMPNLFSKGAPTAAVVNAPVKK